METEGLYNETEGMEIEGVDAENERVESENEVVENEFLPPEKKGYLLWNSPTINYIGGISNRRSMFWNNLIVVSHALCSVVKAYVNIVNSTTSFDDPTPPTNIITNYTILNQYSIKQGIILFGKKGKASVQY